MQKIKCLITDDEPIARQIVRSYCQKLDFVEIVGECENAIDTLNVLSKTDVDVLFLDINMPDLNGLNLLRTLRHKPKVILTTAYKEYAIEAFELEVSDYLLKAFSFERFLKAIQKVRSELEMAIDAVKQATINHQQLNSSPSVTASVVVTEDSEGVFFKVGKRIFRFPFQNILFCEAKKNHTRIVTTTQDEQIYQSLSQIEEQLAPSVFVRTHRSFIVNKNHISGIEGNCVFMGPHEIAIGAKYREGFLEQIGFK